MQGDILFPVDLFNCEDNSSQILCHFQLSFRIFFFGLFLNIILYQYDFSHSICSHRAGSAHNALSLWLSLVSPRMKFFGFDPGAAGLPCMSPLALAFVLVGLCPFGRATFIGWRPLEPPRWSLGVVR